MYPDSHHSEPGGGRVRARLRPFCCCLRVVRVLTYHTRHLLLVECRRSFSDMLRDQKENAEASRPAGDVNVQVDDLIEFKQLRSGIQVGNIDDEFEKDLKIVRAVTLCECTESWWSLGMPLRHLHDNMRTTLQYLFASCRVLSDI